MTTDRLETALAAIDAANREDPTLEVDESGVEQPAEWLYGRRMTHWLDRLAPEAPEHLKLAARAQHIRRWQIPREEYPEGRRGYHRWRTRLYTHHADQAEEILREVGYGEETIGRVRDLLSKKGLRSDPEMQLLEDVICLVFLEYYFAPFAPRYDDEKLIRILRRTWKKMTERGRDTALGLELPERARTLVQRAVSGEEAG